MRNNYSFCNLLRVALFTFCTLLFVSNVARAESEDSSVTPVKILAISDLITEDSDSFLAQIDATSRAQLSFQVKGQVASLPVRMGQRVKKGQVLATLDPKNLQLALDAANAEYLLVKSQLERSKLLFKKKLISADAYDQLETQHKTVLANYQRAKTDLNYSKIRAPFDGMVSYTYVKPHQFVQSNQKILNITNNTKLDASVSLPVSYVESTSLAALQDLEIWLTIDSDPSVKLNGELKEISTKPDEETNSYKAIVSVNKPKNKNYLTGMTGEINIAKPNVLQEIFLPQTAWIERDATQGTVWVMDANSKKVSKKTLRLTHKGAVQSGLNKEDLVVVAGVEKLSENQEVKAWVREEGI